VSCTARVLAYRAEELTSDIKGGSQKRAIVEIKDKLEDASSNPGQVVHTCPTPLKL